MTDIQQAAPTSIFEIRNMASIYAEIRDVYLSNNMPWVIGYSGGKDSTVSLQLIWTALRELPPEQLTKPIYVIATDTLVETPVIVDHVTGNLGKIGKAAQEQGLPITVHRLTPEVTDSFWVNMIGRGYPAPHSKFRWCTERMKIKPADKFILSKVAQHGEVVLILGQRRAESATRAQVMEEYRITGHRLSRHSTLPRAYVYTPIEDFTTDDVWSYLLSAASPWDGNNRDLASLYRLSLTAHKLYGPKGIGALYVRRSNPRVRLAPVIYGGGHERGMRSGTLNVPGIVGFGAAAELAKREMPAEAKRLRKLTELLLAGLRERINGLALNGHPTERLPHNLNIYIPGIESRAFIAGLRDLAIATGSACTSASVEPSHVITALGFGEQRAHGSLRFGLGRGNDQEQVEYALELVAKRVEQLRRFV